MPGRPARPPNWSERVREVLGTKGGLTPPPEVGEVVEAADTSKGYLPWDEFRHRPRPGGWQAEDLWAMVKLRRIGKPLPLLLAKSGDPFRIVWSDPLHAALHRIDTKESLWKGLSAGGRMPDDELSYRLMAAIEEAHHSSAIEGAVTTRRQSRELLRTGRAPQGRSERMVLNNFETILELDAWAQEPLTVERICEIQASVTNDTLENERDVGRIRRDDDVLVLDVASGETVFTPPPAAELPERLTRLCAFANETSDDRHFLHPVLRAILLHHQLAYDHPFADGNGRSARALFMWAILRSGYAWFRSLSISRAVHRARAAYYRSFVHVQDDEHDVTYFVRHQLRCIEQEIGLLTRFLERRLELERWLAEKKAVTSALNARQLALVEHALEQPEAVFSAKEHLQYHGVTQPTAWADLSGLVEQGLLDEERAGRKKLYRPSAKLRGLAAKRRG